MENKMKNDECSQDHPEKILWADDDDTMMKLKKEKEFNESVRIRIKKNEEFLEETKIFLEEHPISKMELPKIDIDEIHKRRIPK